MAAVFPSERNYRFSSSLMNLKFMKKTTGDADTVSQLPKHSVSGPALTLLEASRREVEARQQLPGTVVIEEEHSMAKLYDLVVGRFSFRGINPVLEAALNNGNDSMEEGEVENTDGKDITDAQMAERCSANETIARKFDRRGTKRPSDDYGDVSARKRANGNGYAEGEQDDEKPSARHTGRYFTPYNASKRGRKGQHEKPDFHRGRGRGGGRGGLPRH